MTTPSSPTLPRRFPNRERAMIVSALRERALKLHVEALHRLDEARTALGRRAERYDALADRIRDGGPLSQQIYYGIRVPLRERRDDRKDRTMSTSERYALCEAQVTLDGKRAKVCGARNDFATVVALDSGVHFEWAWPTVARVVANGGAFKS